MSIRQVLKARLRTAGLEVVIPPAGIRQHPHRARIVRFALPEEVRASRHGPFLRVPVDRMTNRAGFAYSEHGWHPYVAALEEHLRRPGLAYRDTVLARFAAMAGL